MITRHMYTSALLSLALFAATANAALAADVLEEESCTADVEFAGYNTTLNRRSLPTHT
jgi:hypothetical protein